MSLWKIAWRSIQQRRLASLLTCISMALGVSLVVAVLLVNSVVNDSFNRNASLGYHLVVGGKNGSKLDLVLTTVYHLGRAEEPLPYNYYKEFITSEDSHGHEHVGKYAAYVARAVPVCIGDSYQGYRVIATTPEMFDFEYTDGKTYECSSGRIFEREHFFEAVIGWEVARKTGLKIGSSFKPTHGMNSDDGHVHDDQFKVVGILKRTGTPNDRVLFINMEGFYLMENHAKPAEEEADHQSHEKESSEEVIYTQAPNANLLPLNASIQDDSNDPHAGHAHNHGPLPEAQREVTAVLLLCLMDAYAMSLNQVINEGKDAQAAQPIYQVQQLLRQFVSPISWILLGLTVLTVLVASIGVMVSIYNSMTGRRHEIAVMRALGAGRGTVMTVVLLESILLSLGGGIAGILIGHSIVAVSSPLLVEYTGVTVGFFQFDRVEIVLIPTLVILASIVGYLPALSAYRTDVAKSLTDNP